MASNEAETLRCEMMAAGDRLILALKEEKKFERINPVEDADAIRKRWNECRRTVERLAEEYATAIDRWRTAVEDATGLDSRIGPSKRGKFSNFFKQPLQAIVQCLGFLR